MIPKILHRIWVGGEPPEGLAALEARWRELHPDWEIRTWRDADLGWLRNAELFDHPEKYVTADAYGQFRADVARYEILHRYGGVYVDFDVEPLKALDPLLDAEGFAGWEQEGKFVGNTVIGAVPGHPMMAELIRVLPDNARSNAKRAATWVSGPRLLTRLYREDPRGMTILPQVFFFPYSYRDLDRPIDPASGSYPDSYCVHHWQHQRDKRNRPLPELTPVTDDFLSISIMAHRKREGWVPELEAQMPGCQVVWDRKNDRWDTGSRALQAHGKSQWHMVVQDDALLPPDFVAGVRNMLQYVPPNNPVGLYYGRVRPRFTETANMVEKAKRQGASFLVHNGPWWGVGIVVPTRHVREIVDWGNRQIHIPNYDRRIARFYAQKGIDCYYPYPSLIEHRHGGENPSLVPGRTALNRRAWHFVGPRSALDVDWDGPIIRSRQ